MFEEVCLSCGKHLKEEGQTYCSDECRYLDTTSPPISTSSSTFSSPHLSYAVGGDVPPLIPSALSTAIQNYNYHGHGRDHQSISSSSASSTVWSGSTDDDDDDTQAAGVCNSDYSLSDDPFYDGPKSASGSTFHLTPHNSRLMSYARRPSGTNNRSIGLARLHQRTSSGSLSENGRVRGIPKSAPIRLRSPEGSSADEDDVYPDGYHNETSGLPTRNFPQSMPIRHKVRQRKADKHGETSTSDQDHERHGTITKSKRYRNRASLPGYFSLLQLGSSGMGGSTANASTSLNSRIPSTAPFLRSSASPSAQSSKPSPPTPKVSHAVAAPSMVRLSEAGQPRASASLALLSSTRRKADPTDPAKAFSRSDAIQERSRSPPRERTQDIPRFDSRASVSSHITEKADESSRTGQNAWSADLLRPRGRTVIRRNSSPPPKMEHSTSDHAIGRPSARSSSQYDSCKRDSRTASPRTRGRARVSELDGFGGSHEAPGYGHGRSGLLDRERRLSARRHV